MNQKLSDWASIAEIVASFAVVVTLVLLLLGIRENSDLVRASAYADSIDGLNDFENTIFSDPELARLYSAFFNEEVGELNQAETRRLGFMMNTLFRSYEKAYFSEQYGLFGEEEWERHFRNTCRNYRLTEALQQWHEVVFPSLVSTEFHDYVVSICSADAE